jgi:hypothetical protein
MPLKAGRIAATARACSPCALDSTAALIGSA